MEDSSLNVIHPGNVELTQHTETPDMSKRREKYRMIKLDKEKKIGKGVAIAGALTTAALAAATACSMSAIPAFGLAYAGAVSLAGGAAWLHKKIELDSMLEASNDQPINELAEDMAKKGR